MIKKYLSRTSFNSNFDEIILNWCVFLYETNESDREKFDSAAKREYWYDRFCNLNSGKLR